MPKHIKGKIRKIKKADLIQSQDLIYACLNLVCKNDNHNIRLRKSYSFVNLEKYYKNSKIFYVYEYEGKVIGTGRIDLKNKIKTIYVHPDYHRRGVGENIIDSLEKYLRRNKIKKAFLSSMETAIKFYEKLGYSKVKNFKKRDNRMEKILF